MNFKKVRLLIISLSGLFLLIDQILKWQAFYHWTQPNLISPYFGWQLFLNKGVAFGLPLSNNLTILITLPMIAIISYLFYKNKNTPKLFLAWSMLLAGSISNLLDRIIYHQVIDYFLIGTAIVNISDLLIVGGLVLYLLHVRINSKGVSSRE
jgi:lipoprotein signal peptidase